MTEQWSMVMFADGVTKNCGMKLVKLQQVRNSSWVGLAAERHHSELLPRTCTNTIYSGLCCVLLLSFLVAVPKWNLTVFHLPILPVRPHPTPIFSDSCYTPTNPSMKFQFIFTTTDLRLIGNLAQVVELCEMSVWASGRGCVRPDSHAECAKSIMYWSGNLGI